MIVMQYHLAERVWERVRELLANSSLKLLWLHPCFLCPHSHNLLSHRKPWISTKSQRKHRSKCTKGLFSWISAVIKCLVSCFTAKLKTVPVATGLTRLAHTTCKKKQNKRTHIPREYDAHKLHCMCYAFMKFDFKDFVSALMKHKLLFQSSVRVILCSRFSQLYLPVYTYS